MNVLSSIFQSPALSALGLSLLHSLWQGVLIGVLLVVNLRALRTAQGKYLAACVALVLQGLIFAGTFALLYGQERYVATETDFRHTPSALEISETAIAPEAPAIATTSNPPPMQDLLQEAIPWIAMAYLVGLFLTCLYNVGGWIAVQRLRTMGTAPVEAWLQGLFEELMGRLKISGPVRLLQSACAQTPVVLGFFKPLILIPASLLTQLSPRELETLLVHELEHVRRQDYLVNLFQTVLDILFFYHPVTWWISARIRTERENCCDDTVVSMAETRRVYVHALAVVAQSYGKFTMSASGGSLLNRAQRILGVESISPKRRSILLPLLGLLALAFCFYGHLHAPAVKPKVPEIAKSRLPENSKTVSPANVDFEAMIQKERALPDKDARAKAVIDALKKWARADPQAASRWVEKQPDAGVEGVAGIHLVASYWAQKDAAAAMRWALSFPDGRDRAGAVSAVSGTVARSDPRAAVQQALQLPDESDRLQAVGAAVGVWAQKDLSGAAQWAERLPPGRTRESALEQVGWVWSDKDLTGATQWAVSLPEATEREQVFQSMAVQIGTREFDPKAVVQWTTQLPEGERNFATGYMASIWASRDIAAATKWILQLPEGETRDTALRSAAFAQNPQAAGQWAFSLPTEKERATAIIAVGGYWVEKDPRAAAAWISGLPTEKVQESAAWHAAQRLMARKDAKSAAQWTSELPKPELRMETMRMIVRKWAQQDAQAARQWASQLHSEQEKADCLLWIDSIASKPSQGR